MQSQPRHVGAGLDVAVVVRREEVQAIAGAGSAGEAHQEADEVVERLLALLGGRRDEVPFPFEDRGREGAEGLRQPLSQALALLMLRRIRRLGRRNDLQAAKQFVGGTDLVLEVTAVATRDFGSALRFRRDLLVQDAEGGHAHPRQRLLHRQSVNGVRQPRADQQG